MRHRDLAVVNPLIVAWFWDPILPGARFASNGFQGLLKLLSGVLALSVDKEHACGCTGFGNFVRVWFGATTQTTKRSTLELALTVAPAILATPAGSSGSQRVGAPSVAKTTRVRWVVFFGAQPAAESIAPSKAAELVVAPLALTETTTLSQAGFTLGRGAIATAGVAQSPASHQAALTKKLLRNVRAWPRLPAKLAATGKQEFPG